MINNRTIGELIENEVRRQQISIPKFAEMICCQRNNVYDIFKRNNMDILQLKQISKVLNRNFFKELAEDLELINDDEDTEKDIMKRKAVSQFFNVVPDVLRKLGKRQTIVFSRLDEPGYEDCPTPDYLLPDYFISFTECETLKERIGECAILPIVPILNEDGCMVEVCTNVIYGSIFVNLKLDYKTSDEWSRNLAFAFEVYAKYGK